MIIAFSCLKAALSFKGFSTLFAGVHNDLVRLIPFDLVLVMDLGVET